MDHSLPGIGLALQLGIGVGHRDRPRQPAVRRPGDRVTFGFLDGQSQRRDERLAPGRIGEHDERRVGVLERPCRLERPRQHLVQVDRPRELSEDPAAPALLLGSLERPGQLSAELVHPGVQACDHLGNPFIGRVVRAPADDEQGQQ